MKLTIQWALAGAILALSSAALHAGQPAPEPAPRAPQAAVVARQNVNVRAKGSLSGEVIGQLKEGESVTILEEILDKDAPAGTPNKWAKIKLPAGISVWVFAEYIHPADKTVTVSRINLRAGPSENHGILGRLDRGEAVQELKTVEGWIEIAAPAGAYAFVAADLLKATAPSSAPPAETRPPASAPPPAIAATETPSTPTPSSAPTSTTPAAPVVSAPSAAVVVATPPSAPVVTTPPPAAVEMSSTSPASTSTPPSGAAPGNAGSNPASAATETSAGASSTPALPGAVSAPATAVVGEIPSAVVAAPVVTPPAASISVPAAAAPATTSTATATTPAPTTTAATSPAPRTETPSSPVAPSSTTSITPVLASPRPAASATSAATNTASAPAKIVVDETRPRRVVRREGIVGTTFSIQAPTYFELISPETRKVIDYLYLSDPTMNLRHFWGKRIIVTGAEGLDPRWPKTPLIEVESMEVVP